MSFLVEDEAQATLAEALAFIDTFGQEEATISSSNSSSEASWSDHSSDSSLYVELRIPKSTTPPSTITTRAVVASPGGSTSGTDSSASSSDALSDEQIKKLRARAANTRAVHRYRKRTKTEILTLREQVQQLDARVTELRARTAKARRSPKDELRASSPLEQLQLQASSSTASALAAAEFRKRQESEALNRRLKEALAKQRKVSAALESVFKKQTSASNLGFVLDMEKLLQPPASATPTPSALDDTVMYAELHRYLEDTVYAGTPAVTALLERSGVDCAFNNTLIKHDAAVGKMFEFLSNTPVAGTREQLSAKLWMILTFPIGAHEGAEDPFANVRMCCAGAVDGQVSMQLECDLGGLSATAVSAIRTFVEPHRTVLTYAALVSVPGTALRFRESAWLILSDASSVAAGASAAPTLFQTVYRLHAEPQDTKHTESSESSESSALTAIDSELHNAVLTKKGERMRGFLVMIQNRLLNGLRELRLDSFLPPCMQIACGA